MAKQWRELENDIGELSAVHDLVVKTAVERYTHPRLLEEPQDEPDSAQ